MRKILIILSLFLLCGCSNSNIEDIYKIMNENEHIIIDVRTEEEYEDGHVLGAINIPYDEIDVNSNLDKDKIIFVYCKSGGRSGIALNTLTSLGYIVYNLGSFSEIALPKE